MTIDFNLPVFSPVSTVENFATRTGVSEGIVRGWMRRGHIPTIKIGRHRLINVSLLHSGCLAVAKSTDGDTDQMINYKPATIPNDDSEYGPYHPKIIAAEAEKPRLKVAQVRFERLPRNKRRAEIKKHGSLEKAVRAYMDN